MLKFGEICGKFFEKTKTGGCIRNLMCYTGRNEKKGGFRQWQAEDAESRILHWMNN